MIRTSWLRARSWEFRSRVSAWRSRGKDHSDIVIRTLICVACRKQTRLQIGTAMTAGPLRLRCIAVTKVQHPLIHSEESGTITE